MDIMNNLNNKLNEEAIISIINALIDKDGFNIKDKWTWKSALSNGLVSGVISLIVLLVGAYVTYKFYKKQEDIRIKNDLKLKYYGEYEEKIIKVISALEKIVLMEDTESDDNVSLDYLSINIECIGDSVSENIMIFKSIDFDIIHKFVELFEDVLREMSELRVFIKIKKSENKIGYDEYDKEYQQLRKIYNHIYLMQDIEELITNADPNKENAIMEINISEYKSSFELIHKLIIDKEISKLSNVIEKKHDAISNIFLKIK